MLNSKDTIDVLLDAVGISQEQQNKVPEAQENATEEASSNPMIELLEENMQPPPETKNTQPSEQDWLDYLTAAQLIDNTTSLPMEDGSGILKVTTNTGGSINEQGAMEESALSSVDRGGLRASDGGRALDRGDSVGPGQRGSESR